MQLEQFAAPAAQHHNHLGCPYLNQTGSQAVRDWTNVLASIDTRALPPELERELTRLRLASDRAERSA